MIALSVALLMQMVKPAPSQGFIPVYPGWIYIGQASAGAYWYIQPDTLTVLNATTRVWVRMEQSEDRRINARSARGLAVITCGRRTYHWEDFRTFSASGAEIPASRTSPPEAIPPDTMIDTVWRRVCPVSAGH
jgi:hypothetical protein